VIEYLAFILLGMYILSNISYLVFFVNPMHFLGRWSSIILRAALSIHILYLILTWVHLGRMPLNSKCEILSIIALCYSAMYVLIEWRTKRRELGGFILILTTLSFTASIVTLGREPVTHPDLRGPIFTVHVLSLILSYSGFFLGFLFSGLYLLLHYDIKNKRLGRIYSRLPSLGMLDTMSKHANELGLALLTIGIIAGSLWAKQVWDIYFGADAKLVATAVIWLIYAAYVALRFVPGWSRKRSAYLSTFGFFVLAFSFVLLTSVATSAHTFHQ